MKYPGYLIILFVISTGQSAKVYAQSLDTYSYANAIVSTGYRYAIPLGSFVGSAPPPPTGPGTATLNASSLDDNATGSAIAFFGSTLVPPYSYAAASLSSEQYRVNIGAAVQAFSTVNYAFQVVGAASQTGASTVVDLTAIGSVFASGVTAIGSASASINIADLTAIPTPFFTRGTQLTCTGLASPCNATPGFSLLNQKLTIPINHIIGVYLSTTANAQFDVGTFQAMLDPIFSLDASQSNLGLELVFGSTITQLPVPESSTYSMLLMGLGMLSLLLRPKSS